MTPLFVGGLARSVTGKPLARAIIDVWHADDAGYYDVQQLGTLERHTGRARFRADEEGRFYFWTVRPVAYPIPHDGPVGQMLAAQERHPYRPAHVHFRPC